MGVERASQLESEFMSEGFVFVSGIERPSVDEDKASCDGDVSFIEEDNAAFHQDSFQLGSAGVHEQCLAGRDVDEVSVFGCKVDAPSFVVRPFGGIVEPLFNDGKAFPHFHFKASTPAIFWLLLNCAHNF